MTDEGREVVANMIGPSIPPGEAHRLHHALVAAVRREEREACAKVARKFLNDCGANSCCCEADDCAAAIRAMKEVARG
jgi:hypothetical protein